MKPQVSSPPAVKPPARRAPQVRKAPARARPARSPDADDSADARDRAIRETAYAFYEARGRVDGHELDDWFEAEAQVDREAGTDPVESIGPNDPEP